MTTQNLISILIADDHPIVRQGLQTMLEPKPIFKIIGEAKNGQEALIKFFDLQPDILILDLIMPGIDTIEIIKQIKEKDKQARILVLTSSNDEQKVIDTIRAGATGYILKDSTPNQLIDALNCVYERKLYLCNGISQKIAIRLLNPDLEKTKEELTTREKEVSTLISQGLSNREISIQLNISEGTVRFHVHNILEKLGLENRTQIAINEIRKNLD
jgi:DNA-binding NarL/FixJ family response regulator